MYKRSRITRGIYFAIFILLFFNIFIHNNFNLYEEKADGIITKHSESLNQEYDGSGLHHKRTDFLGPGENGTAVHIDRANLTVHEKKMYDMGYQNHGFNVYASNMISLDRRITNAIHSQECRERHYATQLPTLSVIIPFRNEAFSTLLRTVHSVINTTPSQYLSEVILVNDGSQDESLLSKLRVHIEGTKLVRLISLPKSQGLMMARQTGIDASTAQLILVMDSHMEVADGWFQPMAQEIKENPRALVTGKVGIIDEDTFEFKNYPFEIFLATGVECQTFDFYLYQTGSFMKDEYIRSRKSKYEPLYVPAIQGNFFLMNRTFFQHLGGFDPGMKLWGGEQFELSFKTWMCGGVIKMVPCALAGHVYRKVKWTKSNQEKRFSNEYRVAAVWMDSYQHDVYEMLGNHSFVYGDITKRRKLREANHCKSFQYYLDTIQKFIHIYIPRGRLAKGMIESYTSSGCIEGATGYGLEQPITTYWCHHKGLNQYWELSSRKDIRHGNVCFHKNSTKHITTKRCKEYGLNENSWLYTKYNEIIDMQSGLCLTTHGMDTVLTLEKCVESDSQKWRWQRLHNDETQR